MNSLEVVVEGYARRLQGGGWEATSTCVLITTPGGVRMIVDPGCHRRRLHEGLLRRGVLPEDVAYVFLTHHHVDHALNAALFPRASVVDGEAVYEGDRAVPAGTLIPGTDVEILQTPGHARGHASLIVPSQQGTVVVAGDVFWWYDGEPQALELDAPDELADDLALLSGSRAAVLARADVLIPGHGRPLAVHRPAEFGHLDHQQLIERLASATGPHSAVLAAEVQRRLQGPTTRQSLRTTLQALASAPPEYVDEQLQSLARSLLE